MSVRLAQIKADLVIYRNTVRRGDAAYLVSEVERLREALTFYADPETWAYTVKDPLSRYGWRMVSMRRSEEDNGDRARAALAAAPTSDTLDGAGDAAAAPSDLAAHPGLKEPS